MPTYEYRCDNDHVFEALQSMSEDPLEVCEICGAPCRRLLSAPAIHYKGSGFYTTDYARKGKKPAGGASGSDSGSGSGSSDGSSSGSSSDSGSKSSEKSSSGSGSSSSSSSSKSSD